MGSSPVVLDASAAIELAVGGARAPRIDALTHGRPVEVPAHFDAEALAGIRRLVLRRTLSVEAGEIALSRIERFAAERIPVGPLIAAAFAVRDRFGPYDALYAVLAKRDSALLITVDGPFARACEGFVDVELAQRVG